jgi:hypothetical protein
MLIFIRTILMFAMGVTSVSAQTIHIVDADPNSGSLRLSTASSRMRLPLHLELDQGDVKGLQMAVDPFVGRMVRSPLLL